VSLVAAAGTREANLWLRLILPRLDDRRAARLLAALIPDPDEQQSEEPEWLPATRANMRNVEPHAVVYDPSTGETFSASEGDYFTLPDDQPLMQRFDSDEPCLLVVQVDLLRPAQVRA
jgi:hypothetical protein